MKIIPVRTRKDMRRFVRLPQKLYGSHRCYAPPIWMDEHKAYTGKSNPILKNADFELFLLQDSRGRAIGRTLAYIDFTHNEYYSTNVGFFGAFDCIDNAAAGRLLTQAAEEWLHGKGMDTIRGPIHPVAENWGFVYKGYEHTPVYMSPWNPAFYHDFFTGSGYTKAKDLLVYEADLQNGYRLPARFDRFFQQYMNRYPGIKIRRLNMRRIKEDAKAIWEITNIALADNWGYVPLELPVMEDMLRKLKLIVDPDAVWMVEHHGKLVGYCLGFPDINILLKRISGRLLPLGWATLLHGAKKLRDYRLFALAVHPDWQNKALDALMYINLYRHLKHKNVRLEANYILEDNLSIKNALERLGMQYLKTYRIYDKPLSAPQNA